MEYLALIGTVTVVHLLAVISPGPDFVITVKNSVGYSRRTGIWTAVGIGLGILVHLVYCIAGLALIISQSIIVFTIVKFLGAAYLIYIGIQSFFAGSSQVDVGTHVIKKDLSPYQAINIGFFTNVLNPKATLFFLSLFTLVIAPETPGYMLVLLSMIMVVNTTLWFALVAVFFTHRRIRKIFESCMGVFHKVLGGVLVAFGVKVAVS